MLDSTRQRSGPQSQALHYSYEKAGLILDNQHIPWNADAVIVEAQANVPAATTPSREDFRLRLPAAGPEVMAESIKAGDRPGLSRIFFRLPPPARTTFAEILWRGKSLGQLTLPVLQAEEFLRHFALQKTALSVQLEEDAIQCQTAVTTQCQSVILSALISSATSLAPLVDLGLCVRIRSEKGDAGKDVPVHLSSSQLRDRQALVAVVVPRPRRAGTWSYDWMIDDRVIVQQQLTTISKSALNRSLRISATRFVLQYADGRLCPTLILPLEGEAANIERIGPCFWVTSSLPGVAGYCELEVGARTKEPGASIEWHRQRVLISDGPTPVMLGTLDRASLDQVKQFELRCNGRLLGALPMTPVPTSSFTSEGGFKSAENFTWSTAADELLQQKLGKLLGR